MRFQKLISVVFIEPTSVVWLQLIRYGFVGGAAFLVDYGTLYLLTDFAGLHHLASAAIAFILGLIANYLLSIFWVFNRSRQGGVVREFVIFAVIGVIGLGINEAVIYLFTDVVGVHYMLSKLISTAIVFFWNFFARRTMCFSDNK